MNREKNRFVRWVRSAKGVLSRALESRAGGKLGKRDTGPEYYRRLICAKLRRKDLEEFTTALEALGFQRLKWELFSSRRSFAMYSLDLSEEKRLHLRLYEVDFVVYVLAHEEPKATNLSFHVLGFLTRAKKRLARLAGSPPQGRASEKQELADYQAGARTFEEILRQQVPKLASKLDFEITDEDVLEFADKYGPIDHLSTAELVVENLLDAARTKFSHYRNAVRDALRLFGFRVGASKLELGEVREIGEEREEDEGGGGAGEREEVGGGAAQVVEVGTDSGEARDGGGDHLEGPAEEVSGDCFLAKATYARRPYVVAACQHVPDVHFLERFVEATRQHHPDIRLFVTSDADYDSEFVQRTADLKVHVVAVADLATLLVKHAEYPFDQDEVRQLFGGKGGLVTTSRVLQLVKKKEEEENVFRLSVEVFRFLRESGRAMSTRALLKALEERGLDVAKRVLKDALAFLSNPMIALLHRRRWKYHAVRNLEEVRGKLKKLEATLKELRS
ncbi:MAG: hypothetical protein Kow0069_27490 [Promethearchaeota archaeon]